MGRYILIVTGLIGPFVMIYYREWVGDMIGEAEWMKKIGGVYIFIIVLALFIFFWTLAEITGTTDILFKYLRNLSPGFQKYVPPSF